MQLLFGTRWCYRYGLCESITFNVSGIISTSVSSIGINKEMFHQNAVAPTNVNEKTLA